MVNLAFFNQGTNKQAKKAKKENKVPHPFEHHESTTPQQGRTTKGGKRIYYVHARKTGTTVHIPCWGSPVGTNGQTAEEEAIAVANNLLKHGWGGPINKTRSRPNKPVWFEEPVIREEIIDGKNPHWRPWLPDESLVANPNLANTDSEEDK